MARKKSNTIKTKAKKVSGSSSKPVVAFNQIRFETVTNEQMFETLIKDRSIWAERQINLDELPLSVHRNLQCRNWLTLCKDLQPLPATLIREFYSNLYICSDDNLSTWIRAQSFVITKDVVFGALNVPHVQRPTYPYSECPRISDVMNLLCKRSVTWGSNPRINSSEFTEFNYIFFKIACHNIFLISHVHIIPIERCFFFLYALVIDASIFFPSFFIQMLAEAHRSKSRKHGLFFPVFIYRVLNFLQLENFLSLKLTTSQPP